MVGEIPRYEEELNAAKEFENKNKLEQWEIELIEKVNKIKTNESLSELSFIDKRGRNFNIRKTENGILVQKISPVKNGKPMTDEFVFNDKEQLVSVGEENDYTETMLVNKEGIVQDRRIWTPDFKKLKASPEMGNLELPDPEINPLKARTLENFLEEYEDISSDKIKELKDKGIIEKEEK